MRSAYFLGEGSGWRQRLQCAAGRGVVVVGRKWFRSDGFSRPVGGRGLLRSSSCNQRHRQGGAA